MPSVTLLRHSRARRRRRMQTSSQPTDNEAVLRAREIRVKIWQTTPEPRHSERFTVMRRWPEERSASYDVHEASASSFEIRCCSTGKSESASKPHALETAESSVAYYEGREGDRKRRKEAAFHGGGTRKGRGRKKAGVTVMRGREEKRKNEDQADLQSGNNNLQVC